MSSKLKCLNCNKVLIKHKTGPIPRWCKKCRKERQKNQISNRQKERAKAIKERMEIDPIFRKEQLKKYVERNKKRRENPETFKNDRLRKRISIRKRKYGINEESYKSLFNKQKGKCALCRKEENRKSRWSKRKCSLVVDHNHKTNKLRGLLCHKCNSALGLFNEDIKLLYRVIKYLLKYKRKGGVV